MNEFDLSLRGESYPIDRYFVISGPKGYLFRVTAQGIREWTDKPDRATRFESASVAWKRLHAAFPSVPPGVGVGSISLSYSEVPE